MEPLEKKKKAAIERVTIGPQESLRLDQWISQVEEEKGFLSISKSDLVNFLIRERSLRLSPKELNQLKAYHYDPLKHMNWIAKELKEALRTNDTEAVARLQKEIKGIEIGDQRNSSNLKRKISRTKKSKETPLSVPQKEREGSNKSFLSS